MRHDFRQAIRLLRLNPGFAALAIVTLALGIGACVTMFSIIYGVLLRPLPYPQPERVVALWEVNVRGRAIAVAWPNFLDWHEQSRAMDGLAAYAGGPTTVLGGREGVRADVFGVSDDFLKILRVMPRLGRPFSEADHRPGAAPVAIVSDEFWRRVLGGDDSSTGAGADAATADLSLSRTPRTVTVDGHVAQVIGVMPPGFAFPSEASVWLPANLDPQKGTRTAHNFNVIGRLADGQSLDSARAEMTTIATRLKATYGNGDDAEGIQVLELRERLVGSSRTPLQVLMGAVLLVLLIACANLANTLLASGMKRRREIAVRAALGASRARLVRQFLIENLVLATAGGVAGLLLSAALLPTLLTLAPTTLPRLQDVHIDARVAAFAVALTLATVAIFGLLPALQTARADLREVLADAARGSSAAGSSRTRALLITSQVAVAFVLLVGSGLLIKSLGAVLSQPLGFDPSNTLTMEIALPETTYTNDAQVIAFYDRLLEATRKLPGVEQAGVSSIIPLSGFSPNGTFAVTGGPQTTGDAIYQVLDGDYFQSMRIPLLSGRVFDSRDAPEGEHVAVVSKGLADRYWPGRSALGQRIRPLGMDRYGPIWLTVVGVVGDVKPKNMTSAAYPQIYVSGRQRPQRMRYTYLIVRAKNASPGENASASDPAAAQTAALQTVLRGIDPNVPPKFATFDTIVATNVADRRFMVQILSTFGVLSLLLTAIGIYGVLAYTVAQRKSEIGIRMALGATRSAVVQLVLKNAFKSVTIGLTAGAVGAWLLTGTIRSFLFNVQTADPLVAVSALAALLTAAALAAAVPAWRASRVDPQVSMRTD
jgi:putative ABC transport system permease protein